MRDNPKSLKRKGDNFEAETLCHEILPEIEPSEDDRIRVQYLAERLQKRTAEIAGNKMAGIDVNVEGSFAKDTWIKEEADVDLFLLFPSAVARSRFEELALEIAEEALAPNRTRRRFAEHPYLEASVENVRINIVPAYKVKRGHWRSSTDRTPFHTRYVQEKLEPDKKREVRLLKQFMKGTGTYGAEIKVGGFSGYLSEILIIKYGSFLNTVKSAASWWDKPIIDIEGQYLQKEGPRDLFREPLIVIDPVDKRRNVASAVTQEKLNEFIAACREFLLCPSRSFFFPEEEVFSEEIMRQEISRRGTQCIFIHVEGLRMTPDVLWGQSYKSLKAICRLLNEDGFQVLRSSVWSEEQGEAVFIIELESGAISTTKTQVGPFVWSEEADRFIRKHLDAAETAYGPWIENDRWMVRVDRTYHSSTDRIRQRIDNQLENIGLGSKIETAIRSGYRLMLGEEIAPFYSRNKHFARHLTRFLKGSPIWLRR